MKDALHGIEVYAKISQVQWHQICDIGVRGVDHTLYVTQQKNTGDAEDCQTAESCKIHLGTFVFPYHALRSGDRQAFQGLVNRR